ncbi:MAG: hypothetical protein ABIA63_03570, partial [bacterium]
MTVVLCSWRWIFCYLIVAMLFLMTFDVLKLQSKYLYFSTEIIFLLFTFSVYFSVFKGKKWNDPHEQDDCIPKRNWKQNTTMLIIYFFALLFIVFIIWFLYKFTQSEEFALWFKSGLWYLYYVVIYGIFFFLLKRHLMYINMRALMVSVLILVPILIGYEAILLAQGTGWRYNHTVIGWLMGVPVDNILFI